LEAILEDDPSILGLDVLLVVGRQVITSFGTRADLLAIDSDGTVFIIEVKKARTPRDAWRRRSTTATGSPS
jgi:RecB family endonuclease NucS